MAAARRFHLGLTIEDDEYMDRGMMVIRRGLDPIGEEDEDQDDEESTNTPLMSRIKEAQNVESAPVSVMYRASGEVESEMSRALVNGTNKMVNGADKMGPPPGYEESERRLSRLVKFEVEMTQLQKAYEMLEMAGAKREKLEMAMRAKLEAEVKRLRDANQLMQVEMESQMTVSSANLDDASMKIMERDQTIVNLSARLATAEAGCNQLQLQLLQCQSQLADRTSELESTRQQLQNALDDIETLRDDLMKKNALADRVSSLQEALATLHEATEKREALEETLRLKLEEEIRSLKKERQASWRQSAPVISPPSGLTMNGQLAGSQDDISGRHMWHSPSPGLRNGTPPGLRNGTPPGLRNGTPPGLRSVGATHHPVDNRMTTTDQAVSELDLAVKSLQAVVRQKEQEVEMLEKRTAASQDWLPPEPTFHPAMPPMTAEPSFHPAMPPMTAEPSFHPAMPPMTAEPSFHPAMPPMTAEPSFRPAMPPMTAPAAVNLPARSTHPFSLTTTDGPRMRLKNQSTPPQQRSSFYGTTLDGLIYEGETLEV
jgi:hypothetical protein